MAYTVSGATNASTTIMTRKAGNGRSARAVGAAMAFSSDTRETSPMPNRTSGAATRTMTSTYQGRWPRLDIGGGG
eukprot:4881849-Prymnesium_polylepis.1